MAVSWYTPIKNGLKLLVVYKFRDKIILDIHGPGIQYYLSLRPGLVGDPIGLCAIAQSARAVSRSTISDYLYVHINMPELSNFNPRQQCINGLMKWNIEKEMY